MMIDPFPPDLRDRMLALMERDPKLRPDDLWFDHSSGWWRMTEWWLKPEKAAVFCRDAMRDLLESMGVMETDNIGTASVCLSIDGHQVAFTVAETMLAALIDATEKVMDAKGI